MKNERKKSVYTTFLFMLLCSAIAMYITMYLNTYAFNHVYFSWTRMYMTIMGTCAMAIIMFLFMRHMYTNQKKNLALIVCSVLLFAASLFLVRNQKPIADIKWMEAMIPHHSIALLTSSKANIKDPEVKQLAEDIIMAQEREIEQMKEMIKRLKNEKNNQ